MQIYIIYTAFQEKLTKYQIYMSDFSFDVFKQLLLVFLKIWMLEFQVILLCFQTLFYVGHFPETI